MLQISNDTPFEAALAPLPNRDGVDTLYTIIKGTFTIGPTLRIADEQLPVTLVDEHYGEVATSSIRSPSDVNLGKPGTDVLLTGSAWAPEGRPTWQMDVALTIGRVSRSLRVSGDRVWQSGGAGAVVAWVAPFERMPLVWERAYGGVDETDKGTAVDMRNPVGMGFRSRRSSRPVDGTRIPNIDDPHAPICSPADTPAPACFAPVAPHWEPRRRYAGTYDDAWQASRAPFLPTDFDPRFFQLAPAGLATATPLHGGDLVDVRGATPDGALQFRLPMFDVNVTYRKRRCEHARPAQLDTVHIQPDAARVILVWSAALACDKDILTVDEVVPTVSAVG